MTVTILYFGVIAVSFLKNVNSDFVPIKWNISVEVGLENEISQEYSVLADIALSTCDLTRNFCDSGCCFDPDCDEEKRKTFNCLEKKNLCLRPFSHYDCECNSERLYWFPVLCFVLENPIYLGAFHRATGKIENPKNFLDLTNQMKYRYSPVSQKISDKKFYFFGSQVLAYMPQNNSYTPYPHALFHEENVISGFSLDCNIPVKYMKNQQHTCYIEMTEENCQNGVSLGVKPYILQNKNLTEIQDIPIILKNLETEEKADVTITFKYSPSKYVITKFKEDSYKYFYSNSDGTDFVFDKSILSTYWNNSICHNIVTRAEFSLIINATEIEKVEIQLYLTNVSFSNSYETIYVERVHNISFVDINRGSENADDSYSYNRGYYIGEKLNVGYIRKNGSEMNWENGQMKIFFNGHCLSGFPER